MGGLDQCCGKLSEESLRSLGRIAVLGALLNQDNQLPLPIWRDSVNLAKITNVMMLENGTQSIVGVEQCTRPIKDVACARSIMIGSRRLLRNYYSQLRSWKHRATSSPRKQS